MHSYLQVVPVYLGEGTERTGYMHSYLQVVPVYLGECT